MSDGTFARLPFSWGIGVDIFFVISGFIMVYSSRDLFGQPNATLIFMKRRILRIVPLYYFYTIAMIVIALLFKEQLASTKLEWDNAFYSFLFFPDVTASGKIRPILGLGWTLNYEMFFYAIFACVVFMTEVRALKWLAAAMIGIVIAGQLFSPEQVAFRFWSSPMILEFLFGCALGFSFQRIGKNADLSMFALLIVAAGLIYYLLPDIPRDTQPRFIFLGLPSFIFVYAFIWHLPDNLEAAFEPLARWLGDSSYSLYLSHPFSLGIFKLVWAHLPSGLNLWLFVTFASLSAIIGGWLSFVIIERPLVRFLNAKKTN